MSLTVWVFMGSKAVFPGGVFSQRESAEEWISNNRLTGVLTEYPVDIGVLDWAVDHKGFKPPADSRNNPSYIGRFTSGAQQHYHYEDGKGGG